MCTAAAAAAAASAEVEYISTAEGVFEGGGLLPVKFCFWVFPCHLLGEARRGGKQSLV